MTLRWREPDSNHWSRHGETLLARAMWFPRTAPLARRGTDPERDEKFESGSLQRGVCCEPGRGRAGKAMIAYIRYISEGVPVTRNR